MKNYNINATGLVVRFLCANCHEEVVSMIESLPIPNYESETIGDSENSVEEEIQCENCGCQYIVNLYANITEGQIDIVNDETGECIEDFQIEEVFEISKNE
ncbi:hypothetical protein [Bacteroides sp.]|uniref:hypothetical protein n=1 Tax=Bacteroides sp. TaxID=29523 RepID=UPI0023C2EBC9|nr:hypothetical protein [Bacteroides sp.]MDE5711787.1 hypothetical protein [Bacteroides sp.]MDE6216043.1 hypothetical protein [Bacteroides sp.]